MKEISETTKNEAKEQKEGFLWISWGPLGASLLGNILTGTGAITRSEGRETNVPGWGTIRVGKGTIRADQGF